MGAAGDLGTHQGRLRVEAVGVDPLQVVPAHVVVAVARGLGEAGGVDPVLLHGPEDLGLVVLGDAVDLREPLPQAREHRLAVLIDAPADAEALIHRFKFHISVSPLL